MSKIKNFYHDQITNANFTGDEDYQYDQFLSDVEGQQLADEEEAYNSVLADIIQKEDDLFFANLEEIHRVEFIQRNGHSRSI